MSQQNTIEKDGCCINAKWTTIVSTNDRNIKRSNSYLLLCEFMG